MTRTTSSFFAAAVAVVIAVSIPAACSGPQPLDVAIRADDQRAFDHMLGTYGDVPRDAFLAWRTDERSITLDQAIATDDALGSTRNPFDARRDLEAVSRGAVIYKAECMACHGPDAGGRGPLMPAAVPSMDFHRFGMRFAVTLHGGAPKSWFRTITDGTSIEIEDPETGPATWVMPAYEQRLAREQIWLVITYLQSLDKDASHGSRGSDL